MNENSVLDCNMFAGNWPFRRLRARTAEDLLKVMDKNKIEKAWVSLFEGVFWDNTHKANELIYKQVKKMPRLIPWAAINPVLPNWEDQMRRCYEEFGMRGIRIFPNYHGYSLDDKCFRSLIETAQKLDMPISIYTGLAEERTHPKFALVKPVDWIPLQEFGQVPRDLSILLCNCKLAELNMVPKLLKKGWDIYAEISHMEGAGVVKNAVEKIGVDRLLFGTYSPYFYTISGFLKMREAELPMDAQQKLYRRNSSQIISSA